MQEAVAVCNGEEWRPVVGWEHRQNILHAIQRGLRPEIRLNAQLVREIRDLRGHLPATWIARDYGISSTHMKFIWTRQAWAHVD